MSKVMATVSIKQIVEQYPQLKDIVEEMTPVIVKCIALIEGAPAISEHHYAEYLAFLTQMEHGSEVTTKLLIVMLLENGANKLGVAAATQIMYPDNVHVIDGMIQ